MHNIERSICYEAKTCSLVGVFRSLNYVPDKLFGFFTAWSSGPKGPTEYESSIANVFSDAKFEPIDTD